MIISHQHKFVFVHNPKTGGTSVKHWLFANGPRLRAHNASSQYFPAYSDFPDHFTCSEVTGVELIENYHKASIVRNTWDRVLSSWKFKTDKGNTSLSFEDFIFAGLKGFNKPKKGARFPRFPMISPQHLFTHVNDEKWVDQVLRFENLQNDWSELQKNIGVENAPLPHSNKSKTKPSEWTQQLIDIVEKLYAKDIQLFGCLPPEL